MVRFAELTAQRGITRADIALACGISRQLAGRWLAGERIAESHASAIASLIGNRATRALYASFGPPRRGRRKSLSSQVVTLLHAADVLHQSGQLTLAALVAAKACELKSQGVMSP